MIRRNMTKRQTLVRNIAALFVGGAILAPGMSPEAQAQLYWDSNGATAGAGGTPTGTWGTSNFWNTDPLGGGAGAFQTSTLNTDNLFFVAAPSAASGNSNYVVTVSGAQVANSLNFQASGATTLSGGTSITLGDGTPAAGGITLNQFAFGSTAQGAVTISTALSLANSQTWTNNSVNALTFGQVTLGSTLTFAGSGNFTATAASLGNAGTGGIIMNGTGVLNVRVATNTNYTGSTTINSGIVLLNAGSKSTGNFNLNGGMVTDYFQQTGAFTSGLGTGANQIQISGNSGFGAGNGTSIWRIGTAGSVLIWGASGEGAATGFFNPTTLKFMTAADNLGPSIYGFVNFDNGLNLNGVARTIDVLNASTNPTNSGAQISGVISNGSLIKTGGGNLTLSNAANSYDGTTTISGGFLTVAATGALGSASNTLVFNGGTLRATGTITSPSTRSVTMTSTGIIDNNGQAISIAGNIGGTGGLTKNSAGTLTLTGTNSYSGVTTVNAGTLAITKEVSLASNTAAKLNVKSGAILALNVDSAGTAGFTSASLNTLLGNISVASTAAQGLQSGAILGIDTSTATGGTFTPSSAITNSTGAFGGPIALTKLGAGTLIFDQANTYTGPTTISAGTLQLNAGGVIATPIGNNATFAINSAGSVTQGTNFGLISGTGAVTNAGAGTLTLNLANTYSGLTTATAGTIALTNALAIQNSALVTTSGTTTYSGGAALTIGGLSGATGNLGSASVLNGYTGLVTALTLNPQSGSVTYGGVISDGLGAMTLTKTGAGTQILTGANTYTGATIVNAGTLTIGVGGSISSSSALQINGGTFSNSNTAGQTLNGLTVGAGNATVNNTAVSGTLALGAITRTAGLFGTVNFATLTSPISTTTGNVNGIIGPWATTGSTTTLRYAVGSPNGSTPTSISAFTGITATANLANVTVATDNFEYSAAATTAADLTANTLRYSGGATTTAIGASNTLTLNGLMQAGTGLLTISGGPASGGILIGSTGELVIVANAQPTTISAAIGGTGRLVYSGVGSILLSSATSNYTGGTVINSGELRIASDAALGNSSGSITLNGGTLRGNTTNPQAANTGGVNITSARDVIVGAAGGTIGAQGNNNFTTSGVLSGTGTLTFLETGGGGGRALNFNSTSNTFTGRLVIPSIESTLSVNSLVDTVGSGNIALTLGAANSGSTFAYGAGATSALTLNNRAIELNASGAFTGTIQNNNTTQAVSIGSNLIATGAGAKTLALGALGTTAPANVFTGVISNGTGGGNVALTKTGTGLWTLSGANTYTGATTVSAGRLSLTNLNAIAGTSSVSVAATGTLGFAIGGTYNIPATINIAGTGATLPGGLGALWFGQGGSYASTLNAPINLTAAATIGSFGNVMTQTLGGTITGTGPLTIQSQGGTTTDTATWNLNAASTYTGNTVFTTSGGVRDMTVKLGVDNALPITTSLNLLSSNSQNVATFTTFDLNGKNQELTGLTDTGGTMSGALGAGKRVINSSATLSTLTINNAGAVTYGTTGTNIRAGTIGGLDAAGAAADNVALTKTGAGVLTLAGSGSSFTGNLLISNGTLTASATNSVANPTTSALGNPQTASRSITVSSGAILNFTNNDVMGNAGTTVVAKLVADGGTIRNTGNFFNTLGPVELNGGTLSSFGGSSANFPSFFLNGTVTVGGSAVSTISSTGANSQMGLKSTGTTFDVADAVVGSGSDLNVTGVLANFNSPTVIGALIKTGPGTMTLSGANTYTGATTVTAGTLIVGVGGTGSLAATTTTVSAGATLGGSGTVAGLVTSTGNISPATAGTAGTFALNGGLTTNAGTFTFDLGAIGSSDLINLGSGVLTGSGISTFTLNNLAGFGIGTYTLVDYGSFAGGTSLSNFALSSPTLSGFNVALADDTTNGAIVLNVTGGGGAVVLGATAANSGTFGNLLVGANATTNVTLTNNGTVATTSISANAVPGFTLGVPVTQAVGTVSPNNTTTASVTVDTSSPGLKSGNLTYTANPGSVVSTPVIALSAQVGNALYGTTMTAATPALYVTPAGGLSSSGTGTAASSTPVALNSTATVLYYRNSTGTDTSVNMNWRTRTAAEAKLGEPLQTSGTNGSGKGIGYLISDVVSLTGMVNTTGVNATNPLRQTDPFVLQVSYNQGLLGSDPVSAQNHETAGAPLGRIFLAWNDSGTWVNAVEGNIGGTPTFAGVTSWQTYYNMVSGVDDYTDIASFIGSYGVDPANDVAWAVLNHNSEFAVIPEPSTLVLGGLALLGFAGMNLRRRRLAK